MGNFTVETDFFGKFLHILQNMEQKPTLSMFILTLVVFNPLHQQQVDLWRYLWVRFSSGWECPPVVLQQWVRQDAHPCQASKHHCICWCCCWGQSCCWQLKVGFVIVIDIHTSCDYQQVCRYCSLCGATLCIRKKKRFNLHSLQGDGKQNLYPDCFSWCYLFFWELLVCHFVCISWCFIAISRHEFTSSRTLGAFAVLVTHVFSSPNSSWGSFGPSWSFGSSKAAEEMKGCAAAQKGVLHPLPCDPLWGWAQMHLPVVEKKENLFEAVWMLS